MANDNHDDLLLYGALAIGIFIIGKSVLNALGVSPEDTAEVKDQTNVPATLNPFNPNFQPEVDSFKNAQTTDPNGHLVGREENYQRIRSSFFDPQSILHTDPAYATELKVATAAEAIYDAIEGFHLVTDPAPILAAFSLLTTQSQVAEMAEYFYANFNVDLMTYLKGSFFKSGLSDTDFATVIRQVNNLPE